MDRAIGTLARLEFYTQNVVFVGFNDTDSFKVRCIDAVFSDLHSSGLEFFLFDVEKCEVWNLDSFFNFGDFNFSQLQVKYLLSQVHIIDNWVKTVFASMMLYNANVSQSHACTVP